MATVREAILAGSRLESGTIREHLANLRRETTYIDRTLTGEVQQQSIYGTIKKNIELIGKINKCDE